MKADLILDSKEQLFIIRLPNRLRGTYITWRMGVEPYFMMNKDTYYRQKKEFKKKYGIDIGTITLSNQDD